VQVVMMVCGHTAALVLLQPCGIAQSMLYWRGVGFSGYKQL
jgi:hypothetical protein